MKHTKPGRKTKTKQPAKQAKGTGKPGVRKQAEAQKPSANSDNADSHHRTDNGLTNISKRYV